MTLLLIWFAVVLTGAGVALKILERRRLNRLREDLLRRERLRRAGFEA